MVKKVVLDPGHGGIDPGAIGPTGVQEKIVVLAIARHAADRLRQRGVNVRLTRDDDRTVSLQERCDIANNFGANCFVSIHVNSTTNTLAEGTEVYYCADPKSAEGFTLATYLSQSLSGVGTGQTSVFGVDLEEIPATAQEAEQLRNRGVKAARFYVLRHTIMPAALVEVAFLSNPKEEGLLESPTFQEQAGEAIARGICAYLGVTWESDWEKQRQAALQELAAKARFNSPHKPSEPVDMGMLAIILQRLGVI